MPDSLASDDSAPTRDNCQMAMLTHLLGLIGLFFPFGNFIGPLVLWLIRRHDHPLIDDQGKESLNFQISYTIYFVVLAGLLVFLAVDEPANFLRWGLVGLLIAVLTMAYIILMIVAGVKAGDGTYYRYPLTLRLIR